MVAVIAANELDDSERYALKISNLSFGSTIDKSGVSTKSAFTRILINEAAERSEEHTSELQSQR